MEEEEEGKERFRTCENTFGSTIDHGGGPIPVL